MAFEIRAATRGDAGAITVGGVAAFRTGLVVAESSPGLQRDGYRVVGCSPRGPGCERSSGYPGRGAIGVKSLHHDTFTRPRLLAVPADHCGEPV